MGYPKVLVLSVGVFSAALVITSTVMSQSNVGKPAAVQMQSGGLFSAGADNNSFVWVLNEDGGIRFCTANGRDTEGANAPRCTQAAY